MTPRLSPSSLTAYEAASGANPRTRKELIAEDTDRESRPHTGRRARSPFRSWTKETPGNADKQGVMGRRTLVALEALLLAASLVGAALTSRASDWQPLSLLIALALLTIVSDMIPIEARSLRLSGSFTALVLAMALLGPAPAVAIAMAAILVDAVRHPLPRTLLLANLAAFATYPLVGG